MEGGAFTVDSTEAGAVAGFRTGSIASAEVRVTRLNSVRHWLIIPGKFSRLRQVLLRFPVQPTGEIY